MVATLQWNVEKVLFDRVATFSGVPSSAMSFPNRSFKRPATGTVWLEARHLPNLNTRLFVGDDEPVHRRGILSVTLHAPLDDSGPKTLTELAGSLAAYFPQGDKLWTADGYRVKVDGAPDVGSADPDDGTWACTVTVRYELIA